MARPPIEEIYQIARQYSRRTEDIDDLVQDMLLEAVRTGKDFTNPDFMGWVRGVLRNRAAFIARTEGRRRKRETAFLENDDTVMYRGVQFPEGFVTSLRPSLRIIARLANCGLNRQEMAYLLHIADTALRQRLTALRRAWKSHIDSGGEGPEYIQETDTSLHNGLIRRSLQHTLGRSSDRIFGSHDPDGHLFVVRSVSAHKREDRGNNSMD